jgi:hypothetical protein
MKALKIITTFILSVALISACRDDALSPVPFDEVTTSYGAYVKETNVASGSFNLYDLPSSNFKVSLQIYDAQQGENFESLDIYVSFDDNTEDNGTVDLPEVKLLSVSASQFSKDGTSGLPAYELTITADQAMSAVGVSSDDIAGSDVFNFRQVLNLKDGRAYTTTNTGLDVLAGPFYSAPFTNAVPLVCPSDIGGKIHYSTTNITGSVADGADPSNCGTGVTGDTEFTPVEGAVGQYEVGDITFGQYDCAWGDTPAIGVTLNESCGLLSLTGGDQYGLKYTIEFVSNNGTELVLNWKNNFGDGGTTTLTREGGWPTNLYTK